MQGPYRPDHDLACIPPEFGSIFDNLVRDDDTRHIESGLEVHFDTPKSPIDTSDVLPKDLLFH